MFSNRNETEQITTEDASSEFKLVTETITGDGSPRVEARYVPISDNPKAIVRTREAGANGVTLTYTITVEDLAPNTITRTTTARVMDGVVVASTSKLG